MAWSTVFSTVVVMWMTSHVSGLKAICHFPKIEDYKDLVEVGVSRQGYGWCDTEGNHRRRAEPLIGLWKVGH